MTNEMLCYDCLIENVGQVPAVTMRKGTALCEKCAREYGEAEEDFNETIGQRVSVSYQPPGAPGAGA